MALKQWYSGIIVIMMINFLIHVQDEVFWSDWRKHSILKVNRRRSSVLNDSNVELVTDGLTTPMDVRIHHSLKQPRCKNTLIVYTSIFICFTSNVMNPLKLRNSFFF